MRKSYRVKKEAEFQTVFTKGKSCANRQFVVYMLEKPGPRFIFGSASQLEKRLAMPLREIGSKRRIRQTLTDLKSQLKQDCDFLVIARPTVAWMSTAEVKKHLSHVLRLAKVLPANNKAKSEELQK